MITIRIPIALERRILEFGTSELETAIKELLIKAREAKKEPKETPGLSYEKITAILSETLGDRLLLPIKPSPAWRVRTVLRVKELGLDADAIRTLGTIAARDWRGGIELDSLLRNALRLQAGEFKRGDAGSNRRVDSENTDSGNRDGLSSDIRIGR